MINTGNIDFEEPETKIGFDDGGTAPPDTKTASQRAIKADYGLGAKSPGADHIYSGVVAGNEDNVRQSAAVDETTDFLQRRNAMISDIARAHGGELSPEQMLVLQSMSKSDYASNPQDVFERKFAERFHTDSSEGKRK
jgi:hypothetical protein